MNKLSYAVFLIVVAVITTAAYHLLEPQWILFRKAENSFSRQDYRQAIENYENLMKSGFAGQDVLLHLGEAYLAAGEPDKAIAVFLDFLRVHPRNGEGLVHLASFYVKNGEFERGIDTYREFLQIYPDNRLIRIYLARALTASGRFHEAIGEYRKVLRKEA